jgi:hypothetical protein
MKPQTRVERFRALTRPARVMGILVWASFLAASIATMFCFALLDPQALAVGDAPSWWSSRLQVYGIGFFFFWLVGMAAATLAWMLAHPRARR